MKIMLVGLGLIGGSMALALSSYPDAELYGVDRDDATRLEALGRDPALQPILSEHMPDGSSPAHC